MSYETKGTVIDIGPVEQITDTFKKRNLIIEFGDNPQYLEQVKFEAHQDRVSLFDNIYAGDEVEVSWNLRGRKWTSPQGVDSWFSTLVCWRVNKVSGSSQPVASTPPPAAPDLPPPSADDSEDSLF